MAETNYSNQDEIQELRKEIFQRQLMELSLSPGVVWNSPEPFKFTTSLESNGSTYTMWLVKTPIGSSRGYQYTLDVMKDGSPFTSSVEGMSLSGERSTYVETLFRQVERDVMQLDKNQKDANQLLMNSPNCR